LFRDIQAFRKKMDAGQLCLGPGITFSDPAVIEALAESVDFVWIDLEHNPIGTEALLAHLIAARAGSVPALVRVPSADVAWIKRVLDIGAMGIIVPQVKSVEEVRVATAACRYPPMGARGYGPRRPARYGRDAGAEYVREANQHVFLAVQIEAVEALNELDAIVRVPGLDSIVVGPMDLSGSMGLLGQLSHPQVAAAIARIVRTARQAGLYVGIGMGQNVDYATYAAELGVQWIQCGGDVSYMIGYADQLFGQIRARLAK
jgi:2-keto-3-deoxy-L-rhamnonate aldolase RhmA